MSNTIKYHYIMLKLISRSHYHGTFITLVAVCVCVCVFVCLFLSFFCLFVCLSVCIGVCTRRSTTPFHEQTSRKGQTTTTAQHEHRHCFFCCWFLISSLPLHTTFVLSMGTSQIISICFKCLSVEKVFKYMVPSGPVELSNSSMKWRGWKKNATHNLLVLRYFF